jgi:hypothetical protein
VEVVDVVGAFVQTLAEQGMGVSVELPVQFPSLPICNSQSVLVPE